MAGPHLADAVTQVDPIVAACTLYRPAVDREHHGVALAQRHHLGAGLHSRTLLCQHELATFEIVPWLGQQHRDLKREHVFAIQVLMQAVIVVLAILQ